MSQEETQFINRWKKYQGATGFIKYIVRYFLLGLIAGPVVLTLLNTGIWKQLKENGLNRSLLLVMFLCVLFSVLPAVTIGLLIWNKNNRRYQLLTTNVNVYKSLKGHTGQVEDPIWDRAIRFSIYPAVPIAVCSFGLLLGYNAPPYYSYPVIACGTLLAFRTIYKMLKAFFGRKYNEAVMVPGVVKAIFIVLSSLVVLSLLNLVFY